MCGIFFAKTKREVNMNKIMSCLSRRGPDMDGYFRAGNLYFFQQRLNILDLSIKGIQPMFDKERNYLILFNGEIYNYKKLRNNLPNYKTFSNTDTEIILELYKKYGEKMLNMLDGMFALLIYNFKDNEIFIARDPLGIKPLFYNKSLGLFSSNMKAIIESKLTDITLDKKTIREFMCFRQNFNGKTLFKNILEFNPGHYMIISKKRVIYERYWNVPEISNKPINQNKIFNLFRKAVQKRLLSDVPVGAFLSGGLDSSFLVAMMKSHQQIIKTIDARLLSKIKGEAKFAKMVSRHIMTKHHYSFITEWQYIKKMDNLIDFCKYPLNVPNEVAISFMSKHLRKLDIGVVLSGEGADELFGGYDRIMGSEETDYDIKDFTMKYNYFKGLKIECPFKYHFWNNESYKENIYRFFIMEHIRGLLKRLDNATMHQSLEGRVPYLDIKLVEYLLQIDPNKRYQKTILKDIARPFLPPQIIKRQKVGFPMSLDHIFSLLQIKKMLKNGRLKKYIPLRELNKALKNKENLGYKMWMIYNMERFLMNYEKTQSILV